MIKNLLRGKNSLGVFYRIFEDTKYEDIINEAIEEGKRSIIVDYEDIIKEDEIIATSLLEDPIGTIQGSLNALRVKLAEEGKIKTRKPINEFKIHELKKIKIPIRHIRYTNVPEVKLEKIGADQVNQLMTIKGIVRSTGKLTGRVYTKYFKCPSGCIEPKEIVIHDIEEGEENPSPGKCSKCDGNLEEVIKDRQWEDILVIKIQEPPEGITQGTQPRQLKVVLEGDVAREQINPGDLIKIIGIIKVEAKKRGNTYQYEYYMQGINLEMEDKKFEEIEITPEDEEAILELSKDPELEEKIINTIAPRIQGYREVKEAIALQLFGGVPEYEQDKGWIRGDIHVLLIGDPGIGKSQTLTYISKNLAPRGIYTTGTGSTGVGLTATTVQDQETKEWVLEGGPLVMADRGLCCIDEFDKMKPEERENIHEPLEQQTVSIAKAGIMATLNSRCGVLAGANPKGGRVDMDKTPKQLINLEDTLISRFDLIFLLKDNPDKEMDSRIAKLILDKNVRQEAYDRGLDPELLKKYIAYARRKIDPELDQESIESGVKYYVDKRVNGSEEAPISSSPRLIEGVKRLTQARSRMFLKETANYEDITKAIELLEYCYNTVGLDPLTGKMDIDRAEGRTPRSEKTLKGIVRMAVIEKKEDMGSYSWWVNPEHKEEVISTIKEECKVNKLTVTDKKVVDEIRKFITKEESGIID